VGANRLRKKKPGFAASLPQNLASAPALAWRENRTKGTTLHAGCTAAAATGVDGWRLVPVDAENGLELAFPSRGALAANLAALIVDAGCDDGVQAIHNTHGVIHSALLHDAVPLFNYGIMTADH